MKKRKLVVSISVALVLVAFIAWWARRTWIETALIHALTEGDTVRAAELVRKGAPVHTSLKGDPTPLHYAARRNSLELAEALITNNANVNSSSGGTSPLYLAVENGHKDMVLLLIKHGADVNAISRGKTPLACATEKGRQDISDLLRQHGAHN